MRCTIEIILNPTLATKLHHIILDLYGDENTYEPCDEAQEGENMHKHYPAAFNPVIHL